MEVVILNGITQTAATGLPKTAEGLNALMQRAYNRICLKRGAFCYDRVLGSRFYMLDAADEHAEERALRLENRLCRRQRVHCVKPKGCSPRRMG